MGKFDMEPARAKLFMHGGSQAVRLPKAFRFEGAEVTVRKEGDKVILESLKASRFQSPEARRAFWARIDDACDEPFPDRQETEALRDVELDA